MSLSFSFSGLDSQTNINEINAYSLLFPGTEWLFTYSTVPSENKHAIFELLTTASREVHLGIELTDKALIDWLAQHHDIETLVQALCERRDHLLLNLTTLKTPALIPQLIDKANQTDTNVSIIFNHSLIDRLRPLSLKALGAYFHVPSSIDPGVDWRWPFPTDPKRRGFSTQQNITHLSESIPFFEQVCGQHYRMHIYASVRDEQQRFRPERARVYLEKL
jgi:hypothetical protein